MLKKKLILIKDSREPNDIYLFKEFENEVLVLTDNLDVGDYSLQGYTNDLMIERKTISDLCGSFTSGRERFEEMWKRTTQIHRFLLIEGNITDTFTGNYRADLHPNSLMATLLSWMQRYGFSWFFVDNIYLAQKIIVWICREFLRIKLEEVKGNG